jgi:hypothetical protein
MITFSKNPTLAKPKGISDIKDQKTAKIMIVKGVKKMTI